MQKGIKTYTTTFILLILLSVAAYNANAQTKAVTTGAEQTKSAILRLINRAPEEEELPEEYIWHIERLIMESEPRWILMYHYAKGDNTVHIIIDDDLLSLSECHDLGRMAVEFGEYPRDSFDCMQTTKGNTNG